MLSVVGTLLISLIQISLLANINIQRLKQRVDLISGHFFEAGVIFS